MSPTKIDFDKCSSCFTCVDVCPEGVYEENDKPIIKNPDQCTDCETCVDECPEGAIEMID